MLAGSACASKSTTAPSSTLLITGILPAVGSTTGGTNVLISGANFAAGATVTVGGVSATDVAFQNASSLMATVAARPNAGAADVVVRSGGGTATLANGFTFVAPSGANRPPIVGPIRSIGSRPGQPSGFADLDETVTLVASVSDDETQLGDLTYKWSGPGTFAGSAGGSVFWRLPPAAAATPVPMTATLAVTESFVEGSVTHQNVAPIASFNMLVHDSQKEILDMGEDFLTLFSRSEVPSNDVLHNFSTTCGGSQGRNDEKTEIDAARRNYVQDFSKFRISRLPPVSFNFGGFCFPFGERVHRADACSTFMVHWELTYIRDVDESHKKGDLEITDGLDYITAVLESNQWRLCNSDFKGTSKNSRTGLSRVVEW